LFSIVNAQAARTGGRFDALKARVNGETSMQMRMGGSARRGESFVRGRRGVAWVTWIGAVFVASMTLACDPFHTDIAHEPPRYFHAHTLHAAPMPVGSIRVMNWNVKFGGGRIDFFFDCFGDRVLMHESEVIANLDGLATAIRHFDPDVVLLQEVDVNSKRSAYVNELEYLLDHTDLNYGVYGSAWKADFIPSDGLGAMDDGNAILSRWPLRDARIIALPLRTDQGAAERYFYLRRNITIATTDLPSGPPLTLLDIHADAYGSDGTKLRHIARFEQELDALNAVGVRFVGGGDLNTLPVGTTQLSGFPDTVCTNEDFIADDYTADVGSLDGLYASYEPVITTARYTADEASFASHTVDGRGFWNRTLDYLFTNGDFVDGTGTVHQDAASGGIETMPLSDHAPLTVELAWP